jgi:DNA-binding MarR family transcriptional regulator
MNPLKHPSRHGDLLNFRLKRLLTLGGAPAIRLCEGGYGVARQEWRLVAALVEGGPMTVGALTQHCGLEPARVSRGVKVLERKGLVARTAAGVDRRRGVLRASERGQALYAELMPRLAAVNRRLMEVLSEDEAALLDDFLHRLQAQAQAIEGEGGGVDVKTGRHLGTARRTPLLWKEAGAAPGWPVRGTPP